MSQRILLEKYMKGEIKTTPYINYLHIYNSVEKKVFDYLNEQYDFKLKSSIFRPKKSRQSSFLVIMIITTMTHEDVAGFGGIGHRQFGEGRTTTYFGVHEEKYYTITVDNRGSSIELPENLSKEEFLECFLHIIDKVRFKKEILEFAKQIE